jgi:hypothetical protein
MPLPEPADGPSDFFISRAGADKGMAIRIAAIIEEAGLEPFFQDKDFGHADFMRLMEQGYESSRMIALLSEEYQNSEHCRAEYNHHLGKDPSNLKGRLIVLRVAPWEPTGSLQNLAYTDLVPVLNDEAALRRVVRAVLGIDKADNAVAFWRSFQRSGQQSDGRTAAELARLKGEYEALEKVAIEKNCKVQLKTS